MNKTVRFLDKIFGFSMMREGANLMVSDVLPDSYKMVRLALTKEGRIQLALARQKYKEKITNRPDLQAMDRWFLWTWKGIIFLIVGYVPLYFFLLRDNSVWPFDFISGFAGIMMICVFGIIALVAMPAFLYRDCCSSKSE